MTPSHRNTEPAISRRSAVAFGPPTGTSHSHSHHVVDAPAGFPTFEVDEATLATSTVAALVRARVSTRFSRVRIALFIPSPLLPRFSVPCSHPYDARNAQLFPLRAQKRARE